MDKKPKQTFLQRRHTDGQEAQEKMFNIANYLRNANQSYGEASPHTSQSGYHQKNLQSTDAGGGVEKTSYTVGGNVNWYSYDGKQYGGSVN